MLPVNRGPERHLFMPAMQGFSKILSIVLSDLHAIAMREIRAPVVSAVQNMKSLRELD